VNFASFAAAHGLRIRQVLDDGRWHRVPTEDKPRKRNGAYVFDGQSGAVRNWATMQDFAIYRDEIRTPVIVDRAAIRARARAAQLEQAQRHQAAERSAAQMLERATLLVPRPEAPWRSMRAPGHDAILAHPYLIAKGFPGTEGLVLDGQLLVPMRDLRTNHLVGMQTIAADGRKLFIPGSRAKGGVFRIGRAAEIWLVEGYATGLSVSAALHSMYRRACVLVCFSAGNLEHVASMVRGRRFVVADNDASCTGEKAATATGLPWVMPPAVGTDANDLQASHGLGAVRQLLLRAIETDRNGRQLPRTSAQQPDRMSA
jgi:putative DNA primase/helicase